jgi:histidinol-phosphatase (PHP family)
VIVDYHLHLRPDGEHLDEAAYDDAYLRAYVAAAAGRGVGEIAITEHVYRFAEAAELSDHIFWRENAIDDLELYVQRLGAARDAGLPILVGLELDWLGAVAAEGVAELAARHPFDVVLGSVHWHGPEAFDHPDYSIWDTRPVEQVWQLYTDAVCAAAASGTYDVMAHPDLAKVFGHRPSEELERELGAQVAEAFRSAGVCAEISSAGLRKSAGDVYPSEIWLEQLHAAEVPITLASDAHLPEDAGIGLDRCLRSAREAGYTSLARFRGREWQAVPLG